MKGATRVGDLALGGKTSCGKLHTDASGKVACGKDADSGITIGVTAGSGLPGDGTSGVVTLNVNAAKTQRRVSGKCAVGSSIREIKADGTVVCGELDNYLYLTDNFDDGHEIAGSFEIRPYTVAHYQRRAWKFSGTVSRNISSRIEAVRKPISRALSATPRSQSIPVRIPIIPLSSCSG
uniref:Uncharacterized protein n=1 Tax=Candidatus Kentrum sp. TC TaxID=2126339 RepID=A0A450Z5H9_9GAMM|nr:MAG: hypothetical protein BECKTC1821D_GA0114238_10671 [Candidatus Kentron sp. TC]